MTKDFFFKGKRWSSDGWLSFSLRDIGLGFHFYVHNHRRYGNSVGITINMYLLFIDFHLEIRRK